jgi:hypothetical protein
MLYAQCYYMLYAQCQVPTDAALVPLLRLAPSGHMDSIDALQHQPVGREMTREEKYPTSTSDLSVREATELVLRTDRPLETMAPS